MSLLALAAASIVALVFWVKYRSVPAAALFLSMASFATAALLALMFPEFALVRDPQTGEQALRLQNQALHKCLYVVMAVAALSFPLALGSLLWSVPKRRDQAVQSRG
jgi:hypothetical protein